MRQWLPNPVSLPGCFPRAHAHPSRFFSLQAPRLVQQALPVLHAASPATRAVFRQAVRAFSAGECQSRRRYAAPEYLLQRLRLLQELAVRCCCDCHTS